MLAVRGKAPAWFRTALKSWKSVAPVQLGEAGHSAEWSDLGAMSQGVIPGIDGVTKDSSMRMTSAMSFADPHAIVHPSGRCPVFRKRFE